MRKKDTALATGVEIFGASEEDAERLDAISRVWTESYLSGDLDRFIDLMRDDVVIMAEGQPTVRGKEAARAFFAPRVGRPDIRFHDTLHEIRVHGDWAYFLGDFVFESLQEGQDADGFRHRGRYFVLYARDENGDWKMFRDMDNALPAD